MSKRNLFLSKVADRLRGSSVETDAIETEFEGMKFKIRRRLPLPLQDWINAALQDDGTGKAYYHARKAAASLVAMSVDGGKTFERMEDLFPPPEGELHTGEMAKHFRAQQLARRVMLGLFVESEFADDFAPDMIATINGAREDALALEALQRAEELRAQQAEEPGESEDSDPTNLAAQDRRDTAELFGDEFGPLSESGLTGG